MFRKACNYDHLVESCVTGNPDASSGKQLHAEAWPLVEPIFLADQREALEKYERLAGSDQTSGDLEEIVVATSIGQVDALFIAQGSQQYGIVDRNNQSVKLTGKEDNGSEDLLNFAAVNTLLNSGQVHLLPSDDMPNGSTVAAVYRFPSPQTTESRS